jgi:DNA-directed RNA polymerase specialized sigma24 family protein
MDVLPRKGREEAGPDSLSGIPEAYARIQNLCVIAGLPSLDVDDVAQDVFLWLLRNGPLLALPAMPYLGAVVRNFIQRYRRERSCRRQVEGVSLADAAEPRAREPGETLESKEILDRVAAVLPEQERDLLVLIRFGYSLQEAANILDIPKGSQGFYKGRLVRRARKQLRARSIPELHLPTAADCPSRPRA